MTTFCPTCVRGLFSLIWTQYIGNIQLNKYHGTLTRGSTCPNAVSGASLDDSCYLTTKLSVHLSTINCSHVLMHRNNDLVGVFVFIMLTSVLIMTAI